MDAAELDKRWAEFEDLKERVRLNEEYDQRVAAMNKEMETMMLNFTKQALCVFW